MLEKIGLPAKPSLRGNTWVVDATHCQGCSSQFTFINRKHHCRRCGGIFCNSCTQQRMFLRGQGDSPVRICDPCKKLEEAARFEKRYGHKGGKGNLKLASRSEDEVLSRIMANDAEDSSSSQVGTGQDGEEATLQKFSSKETGPNADSYSPDELRQEALEEKNKYKALKGEGKSGEALKAFKRAKELERQAAALELQLRKDRKKSLASSSTAESQKYGNSFNDTAVKEKPSRQKGKDKDDLTSELKALGWSDMEIHGADQKPVTTSVESELLNLLGENLKTSHRSKGSVGVDKSQVVALKKNALKLKREGNLVEAKEELKKAKILERELEEQKLLAGADDSDDELSALIKSLDNNAAGDLPMDDTDGGFDYDNLPVHTGDLDVDANFEVTDDDINDPELAATLRSLGWDEESAVQVEENLPQAAAVDREALASEILNLKREAVTQKRMGNISEATSLLKKTKLLEKDLASIDSHNDSPTISSSLQNTDKTSESGGLSARNADKEVKIVPKSRLVIQRELLALKKEALRLRREGKINEAEEELKKGKVLEQQLEDIDNTSQMKVPEVNVPRESAKATTKLPDIPTDLGYIDDSAGDITDHDLQDPTYLALLRNLGWQDEDNEPATPPTKVLKQTPGVSTVTTGATSFRITVGEPIISKAEIQRELLALKRKALALRRQGQSAEAEEVLNTCKGLEAQISEMASPLLVCNSERPVKVETPTKHEVFTTTEPRVNETAAPVLSRPSELMTIDDVSDKVDGSPPISGGRQSSVQQEILTHKRKAVALKRDGKLAEAREELKKAKMLERGLAEEKTQSLSNSSNAEVSSPSVTSVVEEEPRPEISTPKPMTSQERFKLQRECLTHKRNALKLRREGRSEDAEAELELARSLEAQLEEASGSGLGNSSTNAKQNDGAVIEDVLDPQLLSALKAIGLQETPAVLHAPGRLDTAQGKAETLVPGSGKQDDSSDERSNMESQIKAEKLKALNLKRSGKQAEALDAFRRAKQLEKKLAIS